MTTNQKNQLFENFLKSLYGNNALDEIPMVHPEAFFVNAPVEVTETSEHYEITIYFKGSNFRTIKASLTENVLTLKTISPVDENSIFTRSLLLPENINPGGIAGRYNEELLQIELPKKSLSQIDTQNINLEVDIAN